MAASPMTLPASAEILDVLRFPVFTASLPPALVHGVKTVSTATVPHSIQSRALAEQLLATQTPECIVIPR